MQLPPIEDLRHEPALARAIRDPEGHPVLGGIPLLARLGGGGSSSVYLGISPWTLRAVAVRVVDGDRLARGPGRPDELALEASALEGVTSTHLLDLESRAEEAGVAYVVVEYLPSTTGEGMLAGLAGGLPIEVALRLTAGAADALGELHARGLVHRNLKPRKLLVPLEGGPEAMRLGLSGIATRAGEDLCVGGSLVGTPGYMAPEQCAEGHAADPRVDVFGLGATLHALLTGRPPVEGRSTLELLQRTHDGEIADPRGLRDLPVAVRDLLARCLDPDPAGRLGGAHEVRAALEALIAERVGAPPGRRVPVARPVLDRSRWVPCAGCATPVPAVRGSTLRADGKVELHDSWTYVCPRCDHVEVGRPPLVLGRRPQERCHGCEGALAAGDLACASCGLPRGWSPETCPSCGAAQAVHAPHLVDACNLHSLECVACGLRHDGLCIC